MFHIRQIQIQNKEFRTQFTYFPKAQSSRSTFVFLLMLLREKLRLKVKLCLCFFNWAPRHGGVLGEWRYSSTHLDLGTRWRWVVSFTPRLGGPLNLRKVSLKLISGFISIHGLASWTGQQRVILSNTYIDKFLLFQIVNKSRAELSTIPWRRIGGVEL
jgi:hypothetical protein